MPIHPLRRREFLELGAAGLVIAGAPALAGCVQEPSTLPQLALAPNPANAHNQVLSHSVHLPILAGRAPELSALLKARRMFERATPGVHFARAAIVHTTSELTLGVIYDRRVETAINFLTENGAALDAALRLCAGYEPGAACDPVALSTYLEAHLVKDKLFFTAYDKAETEVRACLSVADDFLELLEAADAASDAHLQFLVDRFLLAGELREGMDDAPRPTRNPGYLPFQPHLTNTLTMVQPLLPGRLEPSRIVPESCSRLERAERFVGKHFEKVSVRDAFDFILREGEFAVRDLREHPLAQLHTLHFARVGLIETPAGPSMLFSSVYDGDFTQYVLDFGSRVADQIDFIWGLTQGYPPAGCRDVLAFIDWIRRGQVDVEDFFSAHGNVTLLRIQKATKLRDRLAVFARALPPDGAKLRALLGAFARENQALLG